MTQGSLRTTALNLEMTAKVVYVITSLNLSLLSGYDKIPHFTTVVWGIKGKSFANGICWHFCVLRQITSWSWENNRKSLYYFLFKKCCNCPKKIQSLKNVLSFPPDFVKGESSYMSFLEKTITFWNLIHSCSLWPWLSGGFEKINV